MAASEQAERVSLFTGAFVPGHPGPLKEVLLQGARLVMVCFAGERFFTTAKSSKKQLG